MNDAAHTSSPGHQRYRPSQDDVQMLLRRAAEHRLGLDFLRSGALDAVASTFQVHAFVVDAARDAIRAGEPEGTDVGTD